MPYIIFFLIFQLVIRDKPDVAPSAVAAAPPSNTTFVASFKEMWANKNFMILALAYALVYGVYCAVGATLSNLLNPFGFTPVEISIAGGSGLLAGVLGALAIGCFLDCTALYRRTHISISVMAFVALVTVSLILATSDKQASLASITIGTLLLGVASVSFFPTSLSYGAELTFPLQPALVNACMNFLGQIAAFILMGTSTFITDVDAASDDLTSQSSVEDRQAKSLTALAIFAGCTLLTVILTCCVKEELRRLNYQAEGYKVVIEEATEEKTHAINN